MFSFWGPEHLSLTNDLHFVSLRAPPLSAHLSRSRSRLTRFARAFSFATVGFASDKLARATVDGAKDIRFPETYNACNAGMGPGNASRLEILLSSTLSVRSRFICQRPESPSSPMRFPEMSRFCRCSRTAIPPPSRTLRMSLPLTSNVCSFRNWPSSATLSAVSLLLQQLSDVSAWSTPTVVRARGGA